MSRSQDSLQRVETANLWIMTKLLSEPGISGDFSQVELVDRDTLWLCQNSYWKWPFIVDLPIKNGDFP